MVGQYSDAHFSHFHSMPPWHQVPPPSFPIGQAVVAAHEKPQRLLRDGGAGFMVRACLMIFSRSASSQCVVTALPNFSLGLIDKYE